MAIANAAGTPLQRVDELLRGMTIEEKVMQLSCVVPLALLGPAGPRRGQLDTLLGRGIGYIAGPGLIGPVTAKTRVISAEDRAFLSVETVGS